MVRQALDVLGQAIGMLGLDRSHDRSVKAPAPLVKKAPVGDLVRERGPEGILELREKTRLVKELRGAEVGEASPNLLLRPFRNGPQEAVRHILAEYGGALQQVLLFQRQAVDPAGQYGLDGPGNLDPPDPALPPGAARGHH